MNRPEGISEMAWEAAADPATRILAGEDFSTIEAFERVLFAAQCTIARAIQSSVEAEREACAQRASDWVLAVGGADPAAEALANEIRKGD